MQISKIILSTFVAVCTILIYCSNNNTLSSDKSVDSLLPKISFTISKNPCYTNDTIIIDASPSSFSGGSITSYCWTLPDNRVDSTSAITVSFNSPGIAKIVLELSASNGKTAIDTIEIFVVKYPYPLSNVTVTSGIFGFWRYAGFIVSGQYDDVSDTNIILEIREGVAVQYSSSMQADPKYHIILYIDSVKTKNDTLYFEETGINASNPNIHFKTTHRAFLLHPDTLEEIETMITYNGSTTKTQYTYHFWERFTGNFPPINWPTRAFGVSDTPSVDTAHQIPIDTSHIIPAVPADSSFKIDTSSFDRSHILTNNSAILRGKAIGTNSISNDSLCKPIPIHLLKQDTLLSLDSGYLCKEIIGSSLIIPVTNLANKTLSFICAKTLKYSNTMQNNISFYNFTYVHGSIGSTNTCLGYHEKGYFVSFSDTNFNKIEEITIDSISYYTNISLAKDTVAPFDYSASGQNLSVRIANISLKTVILDNCFYVLLDNDDHPLKWGYTHHDSLPNNALKPSHGIALESSIWFNGIANGIYQNVNFDISNALAKQKASLCNNNDQRLLLNIRNSEIRKIEESQNK